LEVEKAESMHLLSMSAKKKTSEGWYDQDARPRGRLGHRTVEHRLEMWHQSAVTRAKMRERGEQKEKKKHGGWLRLSPLSLEKNQGRANFRIASRRQEQEN